MIKPTDLDRLHCSVSDSMGSGHLKLKVAIDANLLER